MLEFADIDVAESGALVGRCRALGDLFRICRGRNSGLLRSRRDDEPVCGMVSSYLETDPERSADWGLGIPRPIRRFWIESAAVPVFVFRTSIGEPGTSL